MDKLQDESLNDILVTICVSTYNRPEGLDKILNCLTQQTHKNLQIIVSDDCSPNKSVASVFARHASRDKRMEFYLQETNLGYSKNLKFLVSRAVGDYVMWCDDDDWYDQDYVQKCLAALLSNKPALTAFPYYSEADENGEKISGYPDQSKLLDRLAHGNRYFRMLAYLFRYDGYGYCNIYYGLHRKTVLSWFDPEEFLSKFGSGLDQEFGMKLVSLSPVAVVREELLKKTVNNEKQYEQKDSPNSSGSTLKELCAKGGLQVASCARAVANYSRLLKPHQSLLIFLISPIWILSVILINGLKRFSRA